MPAQSATEREMLLAIWEKEFHTTVRVLNSYPSGKEDFRPAEKTRSGRELAWIFVCEEKVSLSVMSGLLEFKTPPPPAQASASEITRLYQTAHREAVRKAATLSDADFNRTTRFPTGPREMSDVSVGQILWLMLMDSVHHRGQLSVYLRMLGAKVPSIYGPSGDEPWL